MDHDETSSGRRKLKFTPKVPPARTAKLTAPKVEVDSSTNKQDEASQARKLMNKFNENLRRPVPKVGKKSSVQVAFGPGAASSTSLRTFGIPKGGNIGDSSKSELKDLTDIISSPLTTKDEMITYPTEASDASPLKIKKDYVEPWDYNHIYYPTTLPLRRPYTGNPEILNEAEFGEEAMKQEYNEKTINPASELGLLEECDKKRLLLFQLPSKLPLRRQSASAKGKEKAGSSTSKKDGCLEGVAEGHLGKMLVYRSGAVKLKLGDVLYDVTPGLDCKFAEDVAVINTKAKHSCNIGELEKHAVITPDFDSLMKADVIQLD